MRPQLSKPPLIEAIFELHWSLPEGGSFDPLYQVMVGELYAAMKEDYPHIERIPGIELPVEVAAQMRAVQYRFRSASGQWPLFQLGPGVLSLNQTSDYQSWQQFRQRITKLSSSFFRVLEGKNPKIDHAQLRYINGVAIGEANPIDFAREKLKVLTGLELDVVKNWAAVALDTRYTWLPPDPACQLFVRVHSGALSGEKAVVWEIFAHSAGSGAPREVQEIVSWSDKAHKLIDDVFYEMISGDLQGQFA